MSAEVDPGSLREHRRLAERGDRRGDHELVARLGHLARADRPQPHRGAARRQDLGRARAVSSVAAQHDRQRSGHRAVLAAGDGRSPPRAPAPRSRPRRARRARARRAPTTWTRSAAAGAAHRRAAPRRPRASRAPRPAPASISGRSGSISSTRRHGARERGRVVVPVGAVRHQFGLRPSGGDVHGAVRRARGGAPSARPSTPRPMTPTIGSECGITAFPSREVPVDVQRIESRPSGWPIDLCCP